MAQLLLYVNDKGPRKKGIFHCLLAGSCTFLTGRCLPGITEAIDKTIRITMHVNIGNNDGKTARGEDKRQFARETELVSVGLRRSTKLRGWLGSRDKDSIVLLADIHFPGTK